MTAPLPRRTRLRRWVTTETTGGALLLFAAAVAADSTFSVLVALAVGPNPIPVVATDAAGNTASEVRSVTRGGGGTTLPPDPETVAPPLAPGASTP